MPILNCVFKGARALRRRLTQIVSAGAEDSDVKAVLMESGEEGEKISVKDAVKVFNRRHTSSRKGVSHGSVILTDPYFFTQSGDVRKEVAILYT